MLDDKKRIEDAIEAHMKWFIRLRVAVKTGKSDFDPKLVKMDNQCDFGKWLYSSFPAALRSGPIYEKIRDLHARFHVSAAKVLEHALQGKVDAAMAELDEDSATRKISRELASQLGKLQDLL
jgi:hypothetical protein